MHDKIEYLPLYQTRQLQNEFNMEIINHRVVLFQEVFRWFEEEHRMRPQFTNTILQDSWYEKQVFYIDQLLIRLRERNNPTIGTSFSRARGGE